MGFSDTWRHVVCIHTVGVIMTNKPSTINACFAAILGLVDCSTGWQQNIACTVVRRVTLTDCLRGSICSALCMLRFRRIRTVSYKTIFLFVLFHFPSLSNRSGTWLNLLKPTGYVMHHQFNIQQLYALPTLYLCVLYLSENKQRLVRLTV